VHDFKCCIDNSFVNIRRDKFFFEGSKVLKDVKDYKIKGKKIKVKFLDLKKIDM